MDKFRIEVIKATPNPQQVMWLAMHQDYSEDLVWDKRDRAPDETKAGEKVIKHLLSGERGHYGPLEHPQITFNVGFFPHSMMQQIRTHRVGISFDVQCLAGDTEVTFVKASGSLKKAKISELYKSWLNKDKENKVQNNNKSQERDFVKNLPLRVLNEETGKFQISRIKDVLCSGVQPVYRLTLEDSKQLDCTTNHKLLTIQGWQRMGKAVGLVVNSDREVIKTENDCWVLCNGVPILEKTSAEQIQSQVKAHPVKVAKVEYLGLQTTYDLEVAEPWHNFVANGIVVHNSFRYTGKRLLDVAEGKRDAEDVFYLRPVGEYTNRQGKRYFYSEEQRQADLEWCIEATKRYQQRIGEGLAEEHARGIIPFDTRQHFVMSCNARSLMHLLDLRWKKDAQLEAQKFSELLFGHFQEWTPQLAEWYLENRAKKARLSP
ncbi:thymidylate synthase, flavin-dependent [Halothece sp. PCC 7418]|uniref:FAD-dependent thymidylate synthase n=1 Tax=Halothece sp. (strain PCC 7418) TaxID=65093 RepID=UPI0002A08331|nr:FAD-dependent thymidylate synthase [Halothece sp. PCC 7418]AFZ45498.1 thymidylate synthase, flavin-dependent [Halothece sp. PCC 7418]